MPPPADFDHLYAASRRRLVLQTFALTGDLAGAGGAVRDAFVAARQRWGKVGRLDDPESWVRSRAWTVAQRRRLGRVRRRERGLEPAQQQVLAALQALPDVQRKTLLLNHLAALSLAQIGREIGETRERAELHLQQATAAVAVALDTDSSAIRLRLEELGPVARRATLPRVTTVHRVGVRRRRTRAMLGALLAVVVALGAGALVTARPGPSAAVPLIGAITAPPHAPARSRPSDGQQAAASPHPVTEAMLLDADQLRRAAPRNDWVVWSTSDNSGGTGLNTACQATRFADPHGLAAFARTFDATGRPRRSAVQTVEVSRTRAAAAAAYATMLRWYADCTRTHAQLVAAFRVSGLGDAARVLTLRLAGHRWYDVGVARSGAVTTLTVLQTRRGGAVGPHATSADLATAVQRLCGADDAGTCTSAPPRLVPSLPRVGGERVGMLATADLPFVDHLARPWVGIRPTPTRSNVAATPCDRTDFHALGARRAVTRTFLVPQARLPERFGLSETYGAFAGGGRATAALHRVQRRMAACSRSDLGARVRHARVVAHSSHGSSYGLWRVEVEVTAHRRVSYWMGVARVGRYLAQVTFSPVPGKDVGAPVFEALVERARDRLLELP